MSNWSLIYPTGTVNLFTNPSLETNTNNFIGLVSGTIARVSTYQSKGVYSLAVTPRVGFADGVQTTGTSLTAGLYNASLDFLGTAGNIYNLYFQSTASVRLSAITVITGTGDWTRQSVSWIETGTATRRLAVADALNNGQVFYIDAVQIENGPLTSYCDGETEDCIWNGARHSSTSTRPNTSTLGGVEKDLEDDYGLKITQASGIGVPDITNLSSDYATQPGAFYQGYSIPPRLINLLGTFKGTSPSNLHTLRKEFINQLIPGKVFVLKYKKPTKPVVMRVTYDSGLGFGKTNGSLEQINLRLIAYSNPYWREENQQGTTLTSQTTVANANRVIRKNAAGNWQALGVGFNSSINDIAYDKDLGRTYFAGNYTLANNVSANRISYWDEVAQTFVPLSLGVNNNVYSIAIAPNHDVWIAGEFTVIGTGTATQGLARWNYATSTWTAFNVSVTSFSSIRTVKIDNNGNVYIGGDFQNWNGTPAADFVAKYDGATWSALGTSPYNVSLYPYNTNTFAFDFDGNLWAGSIFQGTSIAYLFKWDGSSWTTVAQTNNTSSASVNSLFFDDDGLLYIGGNFTTLGGISATSAAVYDGSSFSPLGTGFDSGATVDTIKRYKDMILYGGIIATAGGITLPDYIAGWIGSSWIPLNADFPGANNGVQAILEVQDSLYVGYVRTGTATTAALTSVTNYGTSPAYPVVEFTAPTGTATTIYQLTNETNGESIYFNLSILPGEIITLDLRNNKKELTSSFRGNINRNILKGSNTNTFNLQPGVNSLSLFANRSDLAIRVYWDKQHWAADGSN